MGKTAPHLARVIASANKLPYRSEVKVDVDNMAELMANADIAIGASGGTTWERCCLGLPTIQLITAYNQEFIASKLNKYYVKTIVPKHGDIFNFNKKEKKNVNK